MYVYIKVIQWHENKVLSKQWVISRVRYVFNELINKLVFIGEYFNFFRVQDYKMALVGSWVT